MQTIKHKNKCSDLYKKKNLKKKELECAMPID